MQRSLLARYLIIFLFFSAALSTNVFSLDAGLLEFQDKAQEVINQLSPQNILELFTSGISSFFKQTAISFSVCLCIILSASVFSTIKSSSSDSIDQLEIITCCLLVLSVFSPVTSCFTKVQEHIEATCGFMLSLIPTCVILHTASGNTLSASLMSYGTGSVIALLQTISATLIIPLTKAALSLTTVNSISKNSILTGLSSSIKSTCLWLTGLSFTFLTGVLSLQSLLQAGADNLTIRGLKYGAAKLIPIAGGMISESMRTVITGVGYIKSVTGISGIVFIIYSLIPPLCFVIITKLYLILLSTAAKITSLSGVSGFLDSTNSILDILLSLLLSCSVCLIIILSIFIKSTVSI